MTDYLLGVDLGQASDYTALTVLERTPVDTGRTAPQVAPEGYSGGKRMVQVPITESHYAARHLERLPIGTPYPAQVARIKALHARLTAQGQLVRLVVDQTGVGRPVVDMLRSVGLAPVAVTITGGDSVSRDGADYRVPKRDLVSAVQVLLQSERLKIARALPEAQTLTSELLAFKVAVSLKGHDSYGNDVGPWRENAHDDLVLAVALACWFGEAVKVPVRVPSRTFGGRW
jgi:hypothetical protein